MLRVEPLERRHGCRGRRHEGRLVALAAIGHRREIGSVGLYEQPVERQVAHDRAQIFGIAEGHDPGDRNVKPERDRSFGECPAAAEAMQDPGRRPLFFKDLPDLAIRLASMDDQRKPARA